MATPVAVLAAAVVRESYLELERSGKCLVWYGTFEEYQIIARADIRAPMAGHPGHRLVTLDEVWTIPDAIECLMVRAGMQLTSKSS